MSQPIDYTNLICSFLEHSKNLKRLSLESKCIKSNKKLKVEMQLEDISDDALFVLISHLDVVQIVHFWSTCKRFWNLRTKEILDRIVPYKKIIKYKQWNKGLAEAASKSDLVQIVFFIEKGADNFDTGLANACALGNRHIVDYFLNLGANNWNDAIAHAAKGRHRELIDYLIKKAGPIPLSFEEALYEASRSGDKALVDYIVRTKMNGVGFHPEEAMCAAAYGGNKELVAYFIERAGASFWNGGLVQACKGGHKELAEFFWNKGARDVNMALAFAAVGNNMDMVNWLIQKGGSRLSWERGLEWAVKGDHKELVEFFIKKGAKDPFLGFSAAIYGGHLHYAKQFLQQWYIKYTGTDLDPFIPMAAEQDHREVIEYLVSLGAKDYYSGAKTAIIHGHQSLVEWWAKYIQFPADLGLSLAAEHGHLSLVKYFWKKKEAHSRMVDRAIEKAIEGGHTRVVDYLVKEKEQSTQKQNKRFVQVKK